jgi:hypothetical protein
MANNNDLQSIIDKTERLGVIGSPSSTSALSLDILGSAVNRKLVGELALFQYMQDSALHFALGQITEIELRNIWHEDPTMRSLVRQRGRIDAISERQDTHSGKMIISAVFKKGVKGFEPSILGTIPSTGTFVHVITDEVLDKILFPYKHHLFYLGNVYGSLPKLPLWFKHFDSGAEGAGEAYHLGVFGKTGSGKSVLAKMIILAYARYKEMAILIIDPQGEFSKDFTNKSSGQFNLFLNKLFDSLNKEYYTFSVKNLILDTWELFEQILFESDFFNELTIPKSENRENACSQLIKGLQDKNITLHNLSEKKSFDTAVSILEADKVQKIIYKTTASRDRFKDALEGIEKDKFYLKFWKPVADLFNDKRKGVRTITKAMKWLLRRENNSSRPALIIDLSTENIDKTILWNSKIQSLVIKRILQVLKLAAETFFKSGNNLNTLVVIDEAHRLASRDILREEDVERSVRSVLRDAARTTRKYGLGWLFISQTLSSLDMEIIQQLRIFFFGFGLALGQEFQSLRQLVGSAKNALDLYQLFRDPHSAFDIGNRQYSFMTIGPVSPLSFSGTPLFFNAFNTVEEFLKVNNINSVDR